MRWKKRRKSSHEAKEEEEEKKKLDAATATATNACNMPNVQTNHISLKWKTLLAVKIEFHFAHCARFKPIASDNRNQTNLFLLGLKRDHNIMVNMVSERAIQANAYQRAQPFSASYVLLEMS